MITLIRLPAVEVLRFGHLAISLPLGLSYIAGSLHARGEKLQVVDAVGEAPKQYTRCYTGFMVGLTPQEIVARISPDTDIIGISIIFTHEWPVLVYLMKLIKEARPDCKIVIGGEHATSMPEFCLMTSEADVVVLGEGEITMCEVVDALRNGTPLDEVGGIGFRDSGRVVVNPRRARDIDIDAIPYPAWDYFDLDAYNKNGYIGGMHNERLNIPMLATRGCPYQCTYCSAPNMWTPKWVARDPKLVVDEIEHYVKKYNAGNFPFQDLTAVIKKDWIVEFCQELLKRNLDIAWQMPSGTRSEALDEEVADLFKKTNMINMAYAPESGSESTRKMIKKQMKTENLMRSIKYAYDAGLNVTAFLVIGFPHDTRESIKENLKFLSDIAAAGVTDVGCGFYMALPGTELFNSLQDAGKIKMDREYFRHIQHQQMLFPSQSYCDNVGRLELFYWKWRLNFHFYGAKQIAGKRNNLLLSIGRAFTGVFAKKQSSRLQAAFRCVVVNAYKQFIVLFKKRWMPKADELELFAGFDHAFQQIRRQKQEHGIIEVSPTDTSLLHKRSVVKTLKADHGSKKVFNITAPAEYSLEKLEKTAT